MRQWAASCMTAMVSMRAVVRMMAATTLMVSTDVCRILQAGGQAGCTAFFSTGRILCGTPLIAERYGEIPLRIRCSAVRDQRAVETCVHGRSGRVEVKMAATCLDRNRSAGAQYTRIPY